MQICVDVGFSRLIKIKNLTGTTAKIRKLTVMYIIREITCFNLNLGVGETENKDSEENTETHEHEPKGRSATSEPCESINIDQKHQDVEKVSSVQSQLCREGRKT